MSLKLAGCPTRLALLFRFTASYTSGRTSQRLRSSPRRADLHPPSLEPGDSRVAPRAVSRPAPPEYRPEEYAPAPRAFASRTRA